MIENLTEHKSSKFSKVLEKLNYLGFELIEEIIDRKINI